MRKLRLHRVAIGIALLAILLASLMPAIAQWRAALTADPFAVYCATQASADAPATARSAHASPGPHAEQTALTGEGHEGHGHTLASADHWEKCGYCTLLAHQPLFTTVFATPGLDAPQGADAALSAPAPFHPRMPFPAARARAPPLLAS
ncbi:hypothetical protein PTE30175_03063 [Pandoraea terrae]|uniref:DUF2946 domain-containing protein n=1 Tax=Pandoraea terrae TaxID=1537710 RepID=A0A5E4W860_9BURK|nr:DUF2946 domain-containing protein [Pandoraea terrae]VVE21187.1 hypothetical protein PTE30175_03063 [Pandoraea terrae]